MEHVRTYHLVMPAPQRHLVEVPAVMDIWYPEPGSQRPIMTAEQIMLLDEAHALVIRPMTGSVGIAAVA